MTRLVCLLLFVLLPVDARALQRDAPATNLLAALDARSAEAIGRQIFRNEAAGRAEWLVHWLPGEDHLSLGIGHFIWYPAGRPGPFRESFRDYLRFVERRNVPRPGWLSSATTAPWSSRPAFLAAGRDPRLAELRAFLADTMPEQVAFMAERLARAIPAMLAATAPAERAALRRRIEGLLTSPDGSFRAEGAYVLIDYVNFKGDGTEPGERHAGVGWGLLQVLEAMTPDARDPRAAFAAAAGEVLARRVTLAPPERREARWLDGWLFRIDTYRTFEIPGPPLADQAASES